MIQTKRKFLSKRHCAKCGERGRHVNKVKARCAKERHSRGFVERK